MGFICGVLLMYMGEDDAFLMLVSLLENFSMAGLFMRLGGGKARKSKAQLAAAQQVLLPASEAARDELTSSPCTSYRARRESLLANLGLHGEQALNPPCTHRSGL